MSRRSALVLGDYRQTITVVRSLGRAGFKVVLACKRPQSSTALSKYVSGRRVLDGASAAAYCDSLEECLTAENFDFVFPIGETELRRLIDRGLPLANPAPRWVMPDPAAVLACFDKRGMYELAARLGIPVAPWRPYRNVLDCLRDAEELGYPVVIKRNDSAALLHGMKAAVLRSFPELEAFLHDVQHDPDRGALIVQKYAAGHRHNCHFAARGGRIVAYFQQQVHRTDGRDGTGSGIEGISVAPTPALREYCQRLLGALRYSGAGCIQFLVDGRTGAVAFLEINARLDSTVALPYRLGMDFPLIATRIAAGEAVEAPSCYALGRRYYTLYEDFNLWLGCRREQPAGQLLLWGLKMPWLALRSHDLMFDWRDPLPAVHQYGRKASTSALKILQWEPRRGADRKATVESRASV